MNSGLPEFIAVRAVVVMVSVEVATLPLVLTEAGEKLQTAAAGKPEHDSETLPVNPPLGVSVTVVIADCPAVIVPEAGLTAKLKPDEAVEKLPPLIKPINPGTASPSANNRSGRPSSFRSTAMGAAGNTGVRIVILSCVGSVPSPAPKRIPLKAPGRK